MLIVVVCTVKYKTKCYLVSNSNLICNQEIRAVIIQHIPRVTTSQALQNKQNLQRRNSYKMLRNPVPMGS